MRFSAWTWFTATNGGIPNGISGDSGEVVVQMFLVQATNWHFSFCGHHNDLGQRRLRSLQHPTHDAVEGVRRNGEIELFQRSGRASTGGLLASGLRQTCQQVSIDRAPFEVNCTNQNKSQQRENIRRVSSFAILGKPRLCSRTHREADQGWG